MHISEGVLSAPVLIAGGVLALGGAIVGLKKLRPDQIASTGILSAAFFVASLIHVPIGAGSAHLSLNGLLGVILGWAAFPAVIAALLLQAILFQYGGLTTLGVNSFVMGGSAIAAWYLFKWIRCRFPSRVKAAAFIGGFMGVFIGSILAALALAFSAEGFLGAALFLLLANLPIMIIEGFITMFVAAYIAKTRPQILSMSPGAPS